MATLNKFILLRGTCRSQNKGSALLMFHSKNSYTNAPLRYIIRTVALVHFIAVLLDDQYLLRILKIEVIFLQHLVVIM
jgi:hypothetical protein